MFVVCTSPICAALSRMEPPFPNVLKRSFLRAASLVHRQYVLQHRNGVCVVGLAPEHPILTSQCGSSLRVCFPAGMAVQRKRKRGKQSGTLRAWDTICTVHMGDTEFEIPACIGGQVLELNSRLEQNPHLLLTRVRASSCQDTTLTLQTLFSAARRRGLHRYDRPLI